MECFALRLDFNHTEDMGKLLANCLGLGCVHPTLL